MRALRLPILAGISIMALVVPADAYYQYVHYQASPLNTPVYEKFDLSALPNNTVSFLVLDSGPSSYGANDDFSSVISQVQQAVQAWNGVSSSALRVAFGGLESASQTGNGPGGDVIFTEMPPGVLGMGGVTPASSPITRTNGSVTATFFPIVRSTILLTTNTTQVPGPSYLESFFTTTVHEMGHALGLQHTWTSAAMSQDVIRNTSRARPLDADDIAGLSVLYGNANWNASYGSISGTVTANGQGVALASVVALPQIGPAVSTLTNPDGSFTINGVPPNSYFLYVHPLPPDAIVPNSNIGLRLPVNANGQPLPPFGSAFRTVFYTAGNPAGTNNLQLATVLNVQAGSSLTGQNFSVTPEQSVFMYDVLTASYNASNTASVTPAYVNTTPGLITLAADVDSDTVPIPIPQSITLLGGFPTVGACGSGSCFLSYDNALAIYLEVPPGAGTGPRHLVFTAPNGDMYVSPDAVNLVQKGPPTISSITANANGTVTVTGSQFGLDSRVFFDGAPATIQSTDGQTFLIVAPPSGYSGQNASVTVYNSDGQNSTFYQSQPPPVYSYPLTGAPQFSVDTVALWAGESTLVNINAANMQFVDGQVAVGFGTTDISVRRVWVLSPTHLVANLVVAPGAASIFSEISVTSGFQIASQPGGFFVWPVNPVLPAIGLPIVNANPTQNSIQPGSYLSLYGTNLGGGSAQLTLNGEPVPILYTSSQQINFQVPTNFPAGLATLNLNNGSSAAPPIELEIDNPPPVIAAVTNGSNQPLDASHSASPGDTVLVILSGVDPTVVNNPSRIQATLAGVPMYVSQVSTGVPAGTVQAAFAISQDFGSSAVPIVVAVDGNQSTPYSILVR
jgi:uncharacterized protein (TIGR03437 family)